MIRHLFVPGLLGPMPGLERDGWRGLPHLERLLARADRLVEPFGYEAGLFSLFGIDTRVGADLPTAAVCFLAETGEAPVGFLLHADPLQLFPDRDSLLAFGLDEDPLDDNEIVGLLAAFNSHFCDQGVRLSAGPTGRLYLRCDQVPSIQTHPLSTVIGRNLDPYLPRGEERRRWRSLLNETQMLCHALELNQEREARDRPTLGGLWFSGGGSLPPKGRGPFDRLVGDCPLAQGLLALRHGVGGDELIVEHGPGRAVTRADPDAWLRALDELDDRLPGLLQGCGALHVHPGNSTVYRWHARSAWRLWRRKRPLYERLDANPEMPRNRV